MPKFSLQVTPAVKEERGWKVTALATVLYGNRPPEPPEEVVFDVNGEEFGRFETDPDSGIASSAMLLQPGGYVITVYRLKARDDRRFNRFTIREEKKEKELTPDEKRTAEIKSQTELVRAKRELEKVKQEKIPKPKKPTRDEKKTVTLKAKTERVRAEKELEKARQEKIPKPKEEKLLRVKDLRVWAPGRDGKYVFSISVVSEDGMPAKGAMVRILDENRNLVAQSPTNEYGTVDPPPSVEFSEPMMEFIVDVVGTELDRRLRLTGPSRFRVPPEIPEPTEEEHQLGFWSFIRRAWQVGGDLQRKKEVRIEAMPVSQEEAEDRVVDGEVINDLDMMRREDDNA